MYNYVMVSWDTLEWVLIEDFETTEYGMFDEPTFSSVKESARKKGIVVGRSLCKVAEDAVVICQALYTERGAD